MDQVRMMYLKVALSKGMRALKKSEFLGLEI
jgi:hypothetical protein